MTITELQHQYAGHPNVEALNKLLGEPAVRHIYCGGLYASAASLFASALVEKSPCPFVFILGDLEEAGYFYHDLTQVLGTEQILFFPFSLSIAVTLPQKYGYSPHHHQKNRYDRDIRTKKKIRQ